MFLEIQGVRHSVTCAPTGTLNSLENFFDIGIQIETKDIRAIAFIYAARVGI